MTKAHLRALLKEAIEKAGSAWIFRYWGTDIDKNLDKIALELDQFVGEYHRRFGERPDPLELIRINPLKGAAFFQADTFMVSVEMKVMIWRILLGCEITEVNFKYEAGKAPSLAVTLRPPYGAEEERYVGKQPADFRVFRHLGATGIKDQLYLQGYYSARRI